MALYKNFILIRNKISHPNIIFAKGDIFCRIDNDQVSGKRKGNTGRATGEKGTTNNLFSSMAIKGGVTI